MILWISSKRFIVSVHWFIVSVQIDWLDQFIDSLYQFKLIYCISSNWFILSVQSDSLYQFKLIHFISSNWFIVSVQIDSLYLFKVIHYINSKWSILSVQSDSLDQFKVVCCTSSHNRFRRTTLVSGKAVFQHPVHDMLLRMLLPTSRMVDPWEQRVNLCHDVCLLYAAATAGSVIVLEVCQLPRQMAGLLGSVV